VQQIVKLLTTNYCVYNYDNTLK